MATPDETPELVTGDVVGPQPLPALVTLTEAAEGWQVSVRTLRRRIAAGDLPGSVKLPSPAGDTWHVAPVELEALGIKRRGGSEHDTPGSALVAAGALVADLAAVVEAHRVALAQAEADHRAAAVEAAELRTRVAALDELRALEAGKLTTERDAAAAERDRLAARVAELEARQGRRWWQR
jgi:hypothetical protein